MRLGSLKHKNFTLLREIPVKWTDGCVDVLGIHIPENMKEISTLPHTTRSLKLYSIVQQGNKLTIYGKTTLVNTLTVTVNLSNVLTTNTCRNLL